MFILKKFTQNKVERKVNEFAKAHEKKLKLKSVRGILQTTKVGRKGQVKILTPRNQRWRIVGVSYLLAFRVHFTSPKR